MEWAKYKDYEKKEGSYLDKYAQVKPVLIFLMKRRKVGLNNSNPSKKQKITMEYFEWNLLEIVKPEVRRFIV